MIAVTSSATSVTLRDTRTNNQIAVRMTAGVIEFHQSLSQKDKHAEVVQRMLKDMIKNKLDKRMSYGQRFARASTIIKKFNNADSFQKVRNRLESIDVAS